MSTEQDRVRQLASRIAERVSQTSAGDASPSLAASTDESEELRAVRKSIAELKRKLENIEEHLSHERDDSASSNLYDSAAHGSEKAEPRTVRAPASAYSPWLSGIYVPATHPSQEKFGVEEAAVSELVDFFFEKEKVCELELGGKPCTHCDMCSTRGF